MFSVLLVWNFPCFKIWVFFPEINEKQTFCNDHVAVSLDVLIYTVRCRRIRDFVDDKFFDEDGIRV